MATSMTNKIFIRLEKALAETMCMTLCAMASSVLRTKSCSPQYVARFLVLDADVCLRVHTNALLRFPTPVTSKRDDVADVADDAGDEWGIVHNPDNQLTRCQPCRVRMVTTFRGVRVSLVIAVVTSPHVPQDLHLQRTRAIWAFSTTGSYPLHPLRFAQEPILGVGLLTSSHFNAYVSDRLEFAARRHSEWTTGSRLCCAPRLTPDIMSMPANLASNSHEQSASSAGTAVSKELAPIAQLSTQPFQYENREPNNCLDYEENCHAAHADIMADKATKNSYLPWVQPADIDPRYLDYEQSVRYSSRRRENLERRRALQFSQRQHIKANRDKPQTLIV